MTLRYLGVVLGIFLFLPTVQAMDVPDIKPMDEEKTLHPVTLRPVTVRVWPRISFLGGHKASGGYISLETEDYYMSLRSVHHPQKKTVPTLNDLPPGFAPGNAEMDQIIQDKKLLEKVAFARDKDSTYVNPPQSHPCETYVLYLNTQPMNEMWKEIIENAETTLHDEKLVGRILKKVKYFKGTEAKQTISADQNECLYFCNASLVKGLLYQGGIHKRVYAIQNPIYFIDRLAPPSMTMMADYEDVIKDNNKIMWYRVHIQELWETARAFLRGQKLSEVHKTIEAKGMDYLNKPHEFAILQLLYDGDKSIDENLKDVDNYLIETEKRHTEQQSVLSLSGWLNTIYYKEWKK